MHHSATHYYSPGPPEMAIEIRSSDEVLIQVFLYPDPLNLEEIRCSEFSCELKHGCKNSLLACFRVVENLAPLYCSGFCFALPTRVVFLLQCHEETKRLNKEIRKVQHVPGPSLPALQYVTDCFE
jgi:hypothetical protein